MRLRVLRQLGLATALLGFVVCAVPVLGAPLVAGQDHSNQFHVLDDHSGEDLTNIIISFSDFTASDLRNVIFTGATAFGTDFTSADLRTITWTNAILDNAILAGADLRGGTFAGVSLSGADLSGSDIRGVSLAGVDLTGATLAGAILNGGTDLTGALYDVNTVLGGIDPVAEGMILVAEPATAALLLLGVTLAGAFRRARPRS